MSFIVDLTGRKFGRLLVLGRSDKQRNPSKWVCLCDCGTTSHVVGTSLTRPKGQKYCSQCVKQNKRQTTTHGLSRTKEYYRWINMKQRCNNSNTGSYYRYGGRGIKILNWDRDIAVSTSLTNPNSYNKIIKKLNGSIGA